MKAYLHLCAAAGALVAVAAVAADAPAAPAERDALVRTTVRRLAEQFLSTDPTLYKPAGYAGGKAYGGGEVIHYATVSLWVNALDCARRMGDAALEARLVQAFAPYCGERRDVMNDCRHVDLAIVGAVPLEIAILTGDERAKALGLRYADRQWEEPREGLDWGERWYDPIPLAERTAWWQKGYSPQTRLWIDDMYMITVLQTQAARATGDATYVTRAAREMCLYLARLQRADGLFNHAPGAPFAWGRGNGWMAAAMPMLLKHLKPDDPSRAAILDGYRKMMAALRRHQRASGLWGQIVDDPESWDETSASAMFAYALQEGLNAGLFAPDDAPDVAAAVDRAFRALVAKLDVYGNLADVCAGTGWKNDRRHYLTRPRVNGDPHGQAPLLWLCGALLAAR